MNPLQIGSYYGSEIAPVDLDGDGVTDNLLVAAPMFFSGGWEKGKVYIYRVTEQVCVNTLAVDVMIHFV